MQLAGTKQPVSGYSVYTVAGNVERQDPLVQIAGNTVTQYPVARTVVARYASIFTAASRTTSERRYNTSMYFASPQA